MEKSKLIDLFGLSADPLNNDELDDLLFRLELEIIATSFKSDNALFDSERQTMASFTII
jgi:hypothetical protein